MDFIGFYTTPYPSGLFYKLREDGHIFSFDFVKFQWDDVSLSQEYNTGWASISEESLYNAILLVYVSFSLTFIKEVQNGKDIDTRGLIDIDSFKKYKYYKKDDKIVLVTDKKEKYLCDTVSLQETDNNLKIDRFYKEIKSFEVIPYILDEIGEVTLKDKELYLDPYGNIQAFSKEKVQYELNPRTGVFRILEENKGIENNYKEISNKEIGKYNISSDTVLKRKDIKNIIETNRYIKKNRESLLRKQNIFLGQDLVFYKNPFGKVYLSDERGQKFFVSTSHLIPEQDVNFEKNFTKVRYEDALAMGRFYVKKSRYHQYNNDVLPYDLVFNSVGDKYWGRNEEGEVYHLNDYGYFEKDSVYENILSDSSPCLTDIIKHQQDLKNKHRITEYISYCNSFLNNREKMLDSNMTFYIKDYELYIKDLESIYKCNINSLTPLSDSSITSSLQEINEDSFMIYYLEEFKESLSDLDIRNKLKEENCVFLDDILKITDYIYDDSYVDKLLEQFDDEDFFAEDFYDEEDDDYTDEDDDSAYIIDSSDFGFEELFEDLSEDEMEGDDENN